MEEIGQMEMLQEVLGEQEQECMGFKCRGVYIRRLLEMTILIFDAELSVFFFFGIRCDMFWIGLDWIGLDWIGLDWFGWGGQSGQSGWIWDDNF